MKHIKHYSLFLESNEDFDETYKVVAEQIFYEIDDKFRHDMNQFFPTITLKIDIEHI